MTPDGCQGSGQVELSRTAIRGSPRVADRNTPLIRSESDGCPEELQAEVPVPLAGVDGTDEVRVLHVDDNPQICDLVETFLERNGDDFTVVTAHSAVEALDRLTDGEFDCVVSDYQMPNTDGLELLEIVRERYPDMPFILFTGQGSEEIASEAIAAGVTDYMQKETGTDQYEVLANRVENAVEQHRTEQQFWNALSWYQRLVEQGLAGVCIIQDREFVYVNERLAETFGYDQPDLIGESPAHLAAEGERETVIDIVESDDHGDLESFDAAFTGIRADGREVEVEVSGGPVDYDGASAWIGVLRTTDE
ncbi:response regulator [Haloarcula litorea]|uniref:response regulator n=1 Tax=Haloarcula litorea TaxID=3032579 RepID=UPI0023E806EE|nr:response regulator [Halomicroarcula sp. GDY20]